MKLKMIINLFGGPGVGKSTIAAGLFYQMKIKGYNVEYVSEYAKDLTYEDRFNILSSDQLYIFTKQHRKIYRLKDTVEYIISDSPLLLPYVYFTLGSLDIYDKESFSDIVISTYNKYPNINIFLERNEKYDYETHGRTQSVAEAVMVDKTMKKMLLTCCNFEEMKSNDLTIDNIMKLIREK